MLKPGKRIRTRIFEIYRMYHDPRFLDMDPLKIVHRFKPSQYETAGLIASMFAYGRVETIKTNLQWIFIRTGDDINRFALSTTYREKHRLFEGFRHRFNGAADLALVFECIARARKEHGSLERLFCSGFSPEHGSIRQALDHFTFSLKSYASEVLMDHNISWSGRAKQQPGKSFEYLVASPAGGSACKRMNMYLRWMARPEDGIDLGAWRGVPPSHLIMPVDTHIACVAKELHLTKRKTADWTMAEEITEGLKAIDPEDPVKYDFSLCRSGMIVSRRKCHGVGR